MLESQNPFSNGQVAREWIKCVESVSGEVRDATIYPKLRTWQKEHKFDLILEIGSGQGVCSAQLGPCRYIGVEPAQPLLRRARDIYREDYKTFLRGDACNLPVTPESVDGAFSNMVWMHLDDLSAAAAELAKVLKQGGRFLIFTFNPDSFERWESLHGEAEKFETYVEGSFQLPGFVLPKHRMYLHTIDELLSSFKGAGLELSAIETFGAFDESGDKGFVMVEGYKP